MPHRLKRWESLTTRERADKHTRNLKTEGVEHTLGMTTPKTKLENTPDLRSQLITRGIYNFWGQGSQLPFVC